MTRRLPRIIVMSAAATAMAVVAGSLRSAPAAAPAATPVRPPTAEPTTAELPMSFDRDVLPFLRAHCNDCHDGESKKGGLDLERFATDASAMADRSTWAAVYEKLESHQMPPPKRNSQPTDQERRRVLAYVEQLSARPDALLNAVDPGRPVLRRLTRLEYNNTVRDLFELDVDLFGFPERLPLADKSYFKPESGQMGQQVRVPVRQYGGKYPALLASSGLPGDNRAEHGYRNRGEAMNVSALLLEKYLAVAGEIVQHPDLPLRSTVFADLIGVDPAALPKRVAGRNPAGPAGAPLTPASVVGVLAPADNVPKTAEGSVATLAAFAKEVKSALHEARGGVFDVPQSLANKDVPGKGGVLKLKFGWAGAKTLEINPNADLWLVGFATASPSSSPALIANKAKGEKVYELTFDVKDGDDHEGVAKLGVVVLGRRGQSGTVKLTATGTDGVEHTLSAELLEGAAGNTFFCFAATPGEALRKLKVDGSGIKGDYVLIDDLAFVTNGKPAPGAALPPTDATPPPQQRPATQPATRPASGLAKLPPRDRLAKFMERAFRRPVDAVEVDRYFAVATAARSAGKSDADAMRQAVQAVLASPSFLYVTEPVRAAVGAKVRPLDSFELASRLSYFVWASTPDEELLAAAKAGRLNDPAELERQTRRMLKSPKARELSESFATQWLRLDQLYTAKPDKQLFKAFYAGPQGLNTLHASMLVEALLLFETVHAEDRSIVDFIDANYTWLNPRLAKLYGVPLPGSADADTGPAVPGQPNREVRANDKAADNTWVRVTLPDRNRGGYLTMAAPLTVTSLPFRTSPVKRGAWLLETIFNRPPTEPKVAFVLKDDTKQAATAMSVRQKFEEHRSNPNCYTCHIRLDPPGFALETFDPIGAWRDRDGPMPVDARGEWNGKPFEGPSGFKAVLAAQPQEFTRGFAEHLLSYALGRKLEAFDMPAIAAIQQAGAADGERFSRYVVEVVRSYPFRHVRNAD